MEKYTHITQMENILVQHDQKLKEMNRLLDTLDTQREEYRKLLDYYYSEQRSQDLEDDKNHLIPENMSRGVLTEDEIFDLVGDYRDTAIRMIEIGVRMLKD